MDYRNADGSLSEMCGNGIRVLGRFLATHADVDPRNPLPIATRAGVKTLTFDGPQITVDMGTPEVLGSTSVTVGERSFEARHVSMGNPHAVAFVDDLADAGSLLEAPGHDAATYPDGVNVEFVVRRGEHHLAMRVHERGSGETRSCGTGACAVMVAAALADEAERGTPYTIDLPGGTLEIVWTEDDRILMTGPAVLTAEGLTSSDLAPLASRAWTSQEPVQSSPAAPPASEQPSPVSSRPRARRSSSPTSTPRRARPWPTRSVASSRRST